MLSCSLARQQTVAQTHAHEDRARTMLPACELADSVSVCASVCGWQSAANYSLWRRAAPNLRASAASRSSAEAALERQLDSSAHDRVLPLASNQSRPNKRAHTHKLPPFFPTLKLSRHELCHSQALKLCHSQAHPSSQTRQLALQQAPLPPASNWPASFLAAN